jgi:hypothetical protein
LLPADPSGGPTPWEKPFGPTLGCAIGEWATQQSFFFFGENLHEAILIQNCGENSFLPQNKKSPNLFFWSSGAGGGGGRVRVAARLSIGYTVNGPAQNCRQKSVWGGSPLWLHHKIGILK